MKTTPRKPASSSLADDADLAGSDLELKLEIPADIVTVVSEPSSPRVGDTPARFAAEELGSPELDPDLDDPADSPSQVSLQVEFPADLVTVLSHRHTPTVARPKPNVLRGGEPFAVPTLRVPTLARASAPVPETAQHSSSETADNIAGVLIKRAMGQQGDVHWCLDQFRGTKHPNDTAPNRAATFSVPNPIRLDDWPEAGGPGSKVSAAFQVEWQCNGRSLGNILITNVGVTEADGWGLTVRAQILEDSRTYPPNECAALLIRFYYYFTRKLAPDLIAITDLRLYGNGTYEQSGHWERADAT